MIACSKLHRDQWEAGSGHGCLSEIVPSSAKNKKEKTWRLMTQRHFLPNIKGPTKVKVHRS
jgi:hypothetical protein